MDLRFPTDERRPSALLLLSSGYPGYPGSQGTRLVSQLRYFNNKTPTSSGPWGAASGHMPAAASHLSGQPLGTQQSLLNVAPWVELQMAHQVLAGHPTDLLEIDGESRSRGGHPRLPRGSKHLEPERLLRKQQALHREELHEPHEDDDGLIPTAIVIKNIPFAIKKELLLEYMTKLGLPIPYAFNYHFDNGVFRGLAFANFTSTDETTQVVEQLNGREVGGRKLRVEYKKMLPVAERERIEREKREKRGQLEEQHRSNSNALLALMMLSALNANPAANKAGTVGAPLAAAATGSFGQDRLFAQMPPVNTLPVPPAMVDFNAPEMLYVYTQLLLFREDRDMRYSEVAYPLLLGATTLKLISQILVFLGLLELSDNGYVVFRRRANLNSDQQPLLRPMPSNGPSTPARLRQHASTPVQQLLQASGASQLQQHTPQQPSGMLTAAMMRNARLLADVRVGGANAGGPPPGLGLSQAPGGASGMLASGFLLLQMPLAMPSQLTMAQMQSQLQLQPGTPGLDPQGMSRFHPFALQLLQYPSSGYGMLLQNLHHGGMGAANGGFLGGQLLMGGLAGLMLNPAFPPPAHLFYEEHVGALLVALSDDIANNNGSDAGAFADQVALLSLGGYEHPSRNDNKPKADGIWGPPS